MNFDGKVVVITGASRGMGREMALAFAAEGAHVVVASRKVADCIVVAKDAEVIHNRRALAVGCNVSDWDQCDELIAEAYREFGRVDVLVNNAGLSPLYPSVDQVTEAYFDKVIGVNLKGPFRLASVVGTRMAAAGSGSILNISSIEAIRPDPSAVPYAAAKAALNNLTEGLAHTFGPSGVRVNAIQCGPFLTDISAAWTEEMRVQFDAQAALRRCGNPDEIVGAALYLTGESAAFCTGATLRLDGGVR
ncbi:SDR family NAD(P)-dependent oxidoreductase [Rhodococcus sp. NCIMB 12038]|uniref:SDR family NAD(P)-dependent oxidoreductase n=1 Tax=Rhodococcus sp. NCIMB 12038 TaxID=933800 RepID=UPI000B3C53DB|nr:glucose 1-dehydrogenase [Rhodococcus sp. NCIMB 12038]OUS88556.1 short-chain dehydrogenase [Rhodococcus sp. NCIMB 12038]